ncbi:MAG: formylglycine-generating enzyme family protein [Chloroflexota bacterium]
MEIAQGTHFLLPLSDLSREAGNLALLWIPPGTFLMGREDAVTPVDPFDADEHQFELTITKGYWLGQYLVTQAQWQSIMAHNPSKFSELSPDCPVENINWYQAKSFCEALNRRFVGDLPPEYKFNLPTEAQWEYACRAGTQSKYYSGSTVEDLSRAAWHKGNSSGHTHPVGQKDPNRWNLYDMLGNVFEWCYDSPLDYPTSPAIDWAGNNDDHLRNFRGGSWSTNPTDPSICCFARGYGDPNAERPWFGLRLALTIELINAS